MATAAHTTNVVRLPTAPKRKVQQRYNRAYREAKALLPRLQVEFIYPSERQAMKTAETLATIEPTPELELLTAICAALDDAARTKVLEVLAPGVVTGRKSAVQAHALFKTTRLTIGERVDLDNAMRRLESA